MSYNNINLNRLFTKESILNLVCNKSSKLYTSVVSTYTSNNTHLSNGEIITKLYSYLTKHYRNEYLFKNTLLNTLLLGYHNINTTTALSQVTVEKAKADFILINGKAVVYEIKSQLDNFTRLESQIENYYKAFNHVCILSSESHYEKLRDIYQDSPVGIYVLSSKNTLQRKKEPAINNSGITHLSLFKILRKKEYESILKKHSSTLPAVAPAFYYDACLDSFKQIPLSKAYEEFLKQLKLRNSVHDKDLFDRIPKELKSIAYFADLKEKEYKQILEFINSKH